MESLIPINILDSNNSSYSNIKGGVTTQKSGVVVPTLSDVFLCLGGVCVVVAPPCPPKHGLQRFSSCVMSREKEGDGRVVLVSRSRIGGMCTASSKKIFLQLSTQPHPWIEILFWELLNQEHFQQSDLGGELTELLESRIFIGINDSIFYQLESASGEWIFTNIFHFK